MTRDEQRQAWRAYMTAMLSACHFHDCTMDALADVADILLKTEQARFDEPDHSGDADKMVEVRPWVGLTDAERTEMNSRWLHSVERVEQLMRDVENALRRKNEGTR